jgi:hypothetical protein
VPACRWTRTRPERVHRRRRRHGAYQRHYCRRRHGAVAGGFDLAAPAITLPEAGGAGTFRSVQGWPRRSHGCRALPGTRSKSGRAFGRTSATALVRLTQWPELPDGHALWYSRSTIDPKTISVTCVKIRS